MSRNSSGVYSLIAGNPVVSGEVISSAWANDTLDDIQDALTESLSRDGNGAMLAALELYAGSLGVPGLSFDTDPDTGLYLIGIGEVGFTSGGTVVFKYNGVTTTFAKAATDSTAPTIDVNSDRPIIRIRESDGGSNNKCWYIAAQSDVLSMYLSDDAIAVLNPFLTVTRTGAVPTVLDLLATAVKMNSIDVTPFTGSFTATLSGMTGSTTKTVNYRIINKLCYLYFPDAVAFTGTSNATSMNMTGVPAACQPAFDRLVPCIVTDNGILKDGAMGMGTSGTAAFYMAASDTLATSGFTNSGTKGLPVGWCIAYPLAV